MWKPISLLAAICLATALGGCGLVYHPPMQQGNLLSEDQVAQLKPGMSKQQVVALIGSPSVVSPFDDQRWNYVHTVTRRGGKQEIRRFTLYFDQGTLTRMEGKPFSANPEEMLAQAHMYDRAGTARAERDSKHKGDKD